jgi:hypothetical protein
MFWGLEILLRRSGEPRRPRRGPGSGSQLLVTPLVAIAARDAGAVVTDVGAVELRNVSERVDIYDVRVTDAEGEAVVDPFARCATRAPSRQ